MNNCAFTVPVNVVGPRGRNVSSADSRSSFVGTTPPFRTNVSVPVSCTRRVTPIASASVSGKKVLVIGGTRFSGLYLVHELLNRGADVTILNRGSKPIGDESLRVPGESDEHFSERNLRTKSVIADRSDSASLQAALSSDDFEVIFDNNGRKREDSVPVVDHVKSTGAHLVYMSSAGVYLKSPVMPHVEGDAVDPQCRHKGKLDSEEYMREKGVTHTSIRPTYIYGALNYNPLEQYFFERLDAGRPICVPGYGGHLTGLGHVRDLASAMAACAANPTAYGQIYNVQDSKAVTFDGVAKLCAKAMGNDENDVELVHYDPKSVDLGKLKAFPFRPQHFFCSPTKALSELDWTIEYNMDSGLKDSYENDFVAKKRDGKLKGDFQADELILQSVMSASA